VGVQAQLPAAANLAFFQRTGKLTLLGLEEARLRRRTLVRFWGQRNTVHVYAAVDWPLIHAAFQDLHAALQGRLEKAGLMGDFRRLIGRMRRRLEKGEQLTHKDVRSAKLESTQDRWRVSYVIFMSLVREGIVCHGREEGGEARFVHRKHWTPDLPWDPPPPDEALGELVRRYLACYGPARAHDLAFWYGTSRTVAARWIQALEGECAEVEVDGAKHWCLTGDLPVLKKKPPAASRWPTHLLPRFDPLLLATQDKSWLVEDTHYKKVWRPAAQVEAVLLARGRIAGTWRYQRKSSGIRFLLQPFTPLPGPLVKQLQRQAEEVAKFLGAPALEIQISA
jgi:uncharacterized protein YcaQ